jgi:hypothetical protein
MGASHNDRWALASFIKKGTLPGWRRSPEGPGDAVDARLRVILSALPRLHFQTFSLPIKMKARVSQPRPPECSPPQAQPIKMVSEILNIDACRGLVSRKTTTKTRSAAVALPQRDSRPRCRPQSAHPAPRGSGGTTVSKEPRRSVSRPFTGSYLRREGDTRHVSAIGLCSAATYKRF